MNTILISAPNGNPTMLATGEATDHWSSHNFCDWAIDTDAVVDVNEAIEKG